MYYKLLGCKVFEREIASITYNCRNVIDVTLLRQKLHMTPEKLREAIQAEIDSIDSNEHAYSNDIENNDFDALLVGYGLCSNAVLGIHSRRYKLVIPRAHDCVAMIMGDRCRYNEFYQENPGTFFYWPGMLEIRGLDETEYRERRYQMYLMRYQGDEERAQMMVEVEEKLTGNYDQIAYIGWPELTFPEHETEARRIAADKGWKYCKIEGRNTLLKQMVDGDWPEDRFLIIEPGETVEASYDEAVIRKAPPA